MEGDTPIVSAIRNSPFLDVWKCEMFSRETLIVAMRYYGSEPLMMRHTERLKIKLFKRMTLFCPHGFSPSPGGEGWDEGDQN